MMYGFSSKKRRFGAPSASSRGAQCCRSMMSVLLGVMAIALAVLVLLEEVRTESNAKFFSKSSVNEAGCENSVGGIRTRATPELLYASYHPATVESYVIERATSLGLDETIKFPKTCPIWTTPDHTEIYAELQDYVKELDDYNERVKSFVTPVPDVRWYLNGTSTDICDQLELHPDGLRGIFRGGQLSYTTTSGFIEPLLPPLRHPRFCMDTQVRPGLVMPNNVTVPDVDMNWNYIVSLGFHVHDFAHTCRRHKPTSRNILVDMGASLEFPGHSPLDNPALYAMEIFSRFGFPFDHIYAFEATEIPTKRAYQDLPNVYRHAYHWVNIPVSPDPNSENNPLKLIIDNFNEDDLIVIKLDIDTSSVELPLAYQLLEDPRYERLVDHFYFEHHVHLNEIARSWYLSMNGTVKESLDLFQGLRKKGIPAHYWP